MTLLAALNPSDLIALGGIVVGAAITAYGTYKAATVGTHRDRVAVAGDRGQVETTAATFKAAIEGMALAADEARREAAAARDDARRARESAAASQATARECELARKADQLAWQGKYDALEGVIDDLVERVGRTNPRPTG